MIPRKPADLACPRCHAGPLALCIPIDGDIEPGMTHRERADEASRQTPRPPPPDRGQVEKLYKEREAAWAALDAAARGEG